MRLPDDPHTVAAKVTGIVDIGGQLILHLAVGESTVMMRRLGAARDLIAVGDDVHIGWDAGRVPVIEVDVP